MLDGACRGSPLPDRADVVALHVHRCKHRLPLCEHEHAVDVEAVVDREPAEPGQIAADDELTGGEAAGLPGHGLRDETGDLVAPPPASSFALARQ